MPVPGVRIGSETKLLNDGIVPIGDGRLACAFVRRRVNRDDAGGSFVGVAGSAKGGAVVCERSASSRFAASRMGLSVRCSWGTRAPFAYEIDNMLNPTTTVGSLPVVVQR